MIRRIARLFFSVFALVAAFSAVLSCESGKAVTVADQETSIDSFITSNYSQSTVVRNNGSNRIVLSAGDSTSLAGQNDSVTIVYNAYTFNGSISESNLFSQDSITISMADNSIISGLRNGLLGTAKNEIDLILFSAKYGFYDESVGMVSSMSALAYYLMVTDIKKNNEE